MLMKLEECVEVVRISTRNQFTVRFPRPALTLWLPDPRLDFVASIDSMHSTLESDEGSPMMSISVGRNHVGWLQKSQNNMFGNIVSVGRGVNNDLSLPVDTISKIHALFTQIGNDWRIGDQGATNGLFVNSKQLDQGQIVGLKDGDNIRLGREVEATFHSPDGLYDFLKMLT